MNFLQTEGKWKSLIEESWSAIFYYENGRDQHYMSEVVQ